MGCDIHLHTEIKVDGIWYHYSQPKIMRSYDLFAKMAGVRRLQNSDPPISEPKGLPEDISLVTKLEFEEWGEDAHSMSWFGKEEITELFRWLREDQPKMSWEWGFDYLFGNSWDWWGKVDADIRYSSSVEDIRFVFWFDN